MVPVVAQELRAATAAYEVLDTVAVPLLRRCRGCRRRLFGDAAALGWGGSDKDWYYGCNWLGGASHTARSSPARANRVNASVISRTASSRSASVVSKPRLKRIEDSASSPLNPIALRTCDGSGIPEVQAEPVEAARCGCKALRMWQSLAEDALTHHEVIPTARIPHLKFQ